MQESRDKAAFGVDEWSSMAGFSIAFIGLVIQVTSHWATVGHIAGSAMSIFGLILSSNKKRARLTTAIQISILSLMMIFSAWKIWLYFN